MIYEQVEGFLAGLIEKTKESKHDWLLLSAFPEIEGLKMELEAGISGVDNGLDSIVKRDSYFLKCNDGYVFLFKICKADHEVKSPDTAKLALMVKVNRELPIDYLSSFVDGEEHQKNLAALKELIELYLADKYPLPDTLYQFMSDVYNNAK